MASATGLQAISRPFENNAENLENDTPNGAAAETSPFCTQTPASVGPAMLGKVRPRSEAELLYGRKEATASFSGATTPALHIGYVQKSWKDGVLHPDGRLRRAWEIIMIFASVLVIILVPYAASFRLRKPIGDIFFFIVVLDVFFWADLIINFRTAYWTVDDVLMTHPRDIAKHYCSLPFGRFWWDLLTLLPLDYVALAWKDPYSQGFDRSSVVVASRLLALVRCPRIAKAFHYFGHFEQRMHIGWEMIMVGKMLCTFLFFLHGMACAYFLQAALHNHNPFTYSALNDIVNDAEIMQYTVSVVNILAVANTNGYGSYGSGVPTVPSELNVLTANMLFGAALWAATTGTFTVLVLSLDKNGQAYVQKITNLNHYMRQKNLPARMRARVRDYFRKRFRSRLFDEEAILAALPPSMRREISMHVTEAIVRTVPIFRDAQKGFLNAILPLLRNEFVPQAEIVLLEQEPPSSVYFIAEGTVALLRHGTKVSFCGAGSFFGEISSLWNVVQPLTAFTRTDCELFAIPCKEFNAILAVYDDIKHVFEQLAMQRMVDWDMGDVVGEQSLLTIVWVIAGKELSPGRRRGSLTSPQAPRATLQGFDALHKELARQHARSPVKRDRTRTNSADSADSGSKKQLDNSE